MAKRSLIEYKSEAFKVFDELMVNIKSQICHNIFRSASSLMAFQQFLSKLPQRASHQEAGAFAGVQALKIKGTSEVVSEVNEAIAKAARFEWA